ncbi:MULTISPECIES: hypothetical protein [Streptomyces]|uniref:Secreted protein n=1 Tax=Streptomyces heilongjiangensis TaxID=945052 RepID=A0ABW1B2I2_9ACTN|nr:MULTISPECIES: hypothetical protein [Streptomyces]MDC2946919.1 hypothetical protein [Streptomyces heilongjiangensis]
MSHRTRSARTLPVAAVLLAAAATAGPSAVTPTSEATVSQPPVRPSAQRQAKVTRPVVLAAPDLGGGDVLVRQDGTRGSRVLEFPGAGTGDGGALVVAVRCHGEGRLAVRLRPLGVGFPVECRAGDVDTVQNEFAVSRARDAGTVAITATAVAPGSLRWSLTVGRGAPTAAALTP